MIAVPAFQNELGGRAKHGAAAPVRYTKTQLSRGLHASIGVTRDAGERVLSGVKTAGARYRVAKLLDKYDVEGADISQLDTDAQRGFGETTARNGETAAKVAADGGEDVLRLIARSDSLDIVTTDRLLRAYDDGLVDIGDLVRIADGLEDGTINQKAVQKAISRSRTLDSRGHEITKLETAKSANQRYVDDDDDQPPHMKGTMVVEYKAISPDRFVRVYDSRKAPSGPWVMKESEFSDLSNPADVKDRFGLSDKWGNYDSVAEVTIGSGKNDGILMQMSTAAPIKDSVAGVTRPGGGTQHYAPNAYIEGFEPLDKGLKEFVENT